MSTNGIAKSLQLCLIEYISALRAQKKIERGIKGEEDSGSRLCRMPAAMVIGGSGFSSNFT